MIINSCFRFSRQRSYQCSLSFARESTRFRAQPGGCPLMGRVRGAWFGCGNFRTLMTRRSGRVAVGDGCYRCLAPADYPVHPTTIGIRNFLPSAHDTLPLTQQREHNLAIFRPGVKQRKEWIRMLVARRAHRRGGTDKAVRCA